MSQTRSLRWCRRFMCRAAFLAFLPPVACIPELSGPGDVIPRELPEADLRVMFVGNSLTYTNNLPGLVMALARAGGKSMSQVTIAAPDFSLEDHWHFDLQAEIRRLKPDVVVMQQGPSSLPASREHLVFWTSRIAAVGREVGAEPALLMVWPDVSRYFAFPDVVGSYAAAAQAVAGILIPAGGTWLKAWDQDPSLAFYSTDGFHPSYLGTLAAAHTVYATLFDVEPADVPPLADGVPQAVLDILHVAVTRSTREDWLAPQATR